MTVMMGVGRLVEAVVGLRIPFAGVRALAVRVKSGFSLCLCFCLWRNIPPLLNERGLLACIL